MVASIRTTLYDSPGGAVVGAAVTNQSRSDLRPTYHVVAESLNAATTYAWTLQFTPMSSGGGADPLEGQTSSAAFLPPENDDSQACKFNVDHPGSYLLKLTVDAGLGTEDTQYVRLRALTTFGGLRLVSAGERKSTALSIPVDAAAEGWANDQNLNLQRLLALVRRNATSGRVLYVDANRGRSRTYGKDDPSNVLEMPGADSTDRTGSGIGIRAEGFADFSSITDAINYANSAVSRGEPAPSYSDPFVIFVQPGLYEENLVLRAHVHVIGLGTKPVFDYFDNYAGGVSVVSSVDAVVIRPATSGGNTTFSPVAGPETDGTYLESLVLENIDSASEAPVLKHTGGLLVTRNVLLKQGADSADMGPAFLMETTEASSKPTLVAYDTYIYSAAMTNTDRYAAVVDAANATVHFNRGSILGLGSALKMNESMYENCVVHLSGQESVACATGYAIRGYPSSLVVQQGTKVSSGGVAAFSIDPFGLGSESHPGDVSIELHHCHIDDDIIFDTTGVSGDSSFIASSVTTRGEVLFPGGTPDEVVGSTIASSLGYDERYVDPASGSPAVPEQARLGVSTVQDALDKIVNLVLPQGEPPFYSLDSAYKGLATVDPLTLGSGAGRRIVAGDEAVQIVASNPPAGAPRGATAGGSMDGWLQVEAGVDIGGLVNDGTGSEISLHPNLFEGGPRILMGRTVWSEEIGTVRGLPSATIIAEMKDRVEASYHLRLKTKDAIDSLLGGLGRVIIEAGNTFDLLGTATPGSVYIQAGDYLNSGSGVGLPGDVWLSPGTSARAGVEDGYVRLVKPSDSTAASLQASAHFTGGVEGAIHFATPNGVVTVPVLSSDTIGDVITRVNSTGDLVGSSVTVGPSTFLVVSTTAKGPNADVMYVGDSVGGDLNVALGDFRITHGAVYTSGTYPSSSGIRCDSDGSLETEGDFKVNGTITATGGFTSTPIVHTRQAEDADTGVGVRYTVNATTSYVGVNTTSPSAGRVTIELPNALVDGATEGRQIVVKDEGGGCGTPGQEILIEVGSAGTHGTIDGTVRDGSSPLVIDTSYQSYTLVCAGVSGGVANWFII